MATSGLLSAQNTLEEYDPYMREPLPAGAPEWMQAIADNPTGVNFAKMDSLFADWMAKDVDARVKTIDRKPAVNFYRRWMKAYRPFVTPDGHIKLPSYQWYTDRLDKQNKRSAAMMHTRSAAGKQWRNIGPNKTMVSTAGAAKLKDSQTCVYRIDVARTKPTTVYCGTETGVVFKTTDKGDTWKPCAPLHNFGGPIYAIHVSPTNENVVYVGGGLSLWKTQDGGNTWVRMSGIDKRVNSIRVSPRNEQFITVSAGINKGNGGAFYVSVDGGKNFKKTFSGPCHDHELHPDNDNRIYLLAKPEGREHFTFHISEDGGNHFTEKPMPVPYITAGRLAVGHGAQGKEYVYALVNSKQYDDIGAYYGGLGLPHILQSKDGGQSWTDHTTRQGKGQTFSEYIDNEKGGQGYFDMTVGVSPDNPEHVIFGLCNAYRSEQGGKGDRNKTAIGGYHKQHAMHPDIQDIAICGKDTWICTDGGVKYSADFFKTDGIDRNFGIYASDYHGFGQGWNEDVMAGGRWHNGDAVYHEGYEEGTTLHVGGVEYATGHIMLSEPRKVYFSDYGMHVLPKDINGKLSSTHMEQFHTKKPIETLQTSKELCFDPRYAKRVVMSSREYNDLGLVFVSEDEGRSFRQFYDLDGEEVAGYEFARSNPDYIYVAGKFNVAYSIDNGQNWEWMETRPFDDITSYSSTGISIAVDPRDEKTLWWANVNFPGKLAYTKDMGQTWQYPLTDDMKNLLFNWIILTGNEHNGVYVGTAGEARVYYKDDTMDKWVNYSAGLPPGARITRLTPFYKEGKLRAATDQGIWEIPLYKEHFVPVAQPMALNIGNGDITHTPDKEIVFDSYSIVNQKDVQWAWSFSPQPKQVIDADKRTARVVFGKAGHYDVTLKITTPQGTDSRTIKNMIRIGGAAGIDKVQTAPGILVALHDDATLLLQTNNLTEAGVLTLHDAKGRLLQTYPIEAGKTSRHLALPALQSGVYIYELRTKSHKFFGKFIKNK